MKFGLFLQPVHRPTEHPTIALEHDLDLVVHLDKLGFDEVWIGEHHSTGWENIAAPDAFIAAAAERTRHIRLGTGIMQVGLHHPLVLLDRMIFLDHLTRGRAMFGMGVGGGLPSDLKVFGLSPEQAGLRLEEGFDVMMRLLHADEPITEKTDWYELHHAVLPLQPYSKPHMHLAMATTQPRNLELMGQVGGSVLTGPLAHRVPELHAHLESGAAAVGRTASRSQIMLSYGLHIADSKEEAMAQIRDGVLDEQRHFTTAVNRQLAPDLGDDELVDRLMGRMLIGSPDDVADRIERIVEESAGGFGGILFISRDWAGREASWLSWERFARQVAPRFQGHVGQQARAAKAAGELNA